MKRSSVIVIEDEDEETQKCEDVNMSAVSKSKETQEETQEQTTKKATTPKEKCARMMCCVCNEDISELSEADKQQQQHKQMS